MAVTDQYIHLLTVSEPLREPVIRAAIEALHLPAGSHGLDAGCGLGFQAQLLARAVGAAGRVTGLDLSPAFLARAREMAEQAGLAARVTFRQGDIYHLPFDDGTFDWLWSADCAGYQVRDPKGLLRELARVVKPGGRVVTLVYSSQVLLPGHPRLEARLGATAAGIAPFAPGMAPEAHYLRALGWFREAGLAACSAHTFVGEAHAPLSAALREALAALLWMRWGEAEGELTAEDWAAFQRLSRPDSPGCILDRPDYYGFFTYSLFQGRVP